jgi:hypothetical protein
MRVAAGCIEPLVLRVGRHAGALLQQLRHGVEHILDEGAVPRVPPPVALDVMSQVLTVVPAQ